MKIGMLFPGYGSQFVGMSKELYDNSRLIQEYFEQASHCLDTNFVKLCFASSDIELSKINNAYTSLFLVSCATAELVKEKLKEKDLNINGVAGYGIGEYSALCMASGINFPDGLYLLNKLSLFYNEVRTNLDIKSIKIEGLTAKELKQICQEYQIECEDLYIAIYDGQIQHIVTGPSDTVDRLLKDIGRSGKKIKSKQTIEGFHTPILNQVSDQLRIYLNKVDFKDLTIPLISNSTAKEVSKAQKVQDIILRQIIQPVHWHNTLKQFSDFDVIIIPSPSHMLYEQVKLYYPDKNIICIDYLSDLDKLNNIDIE